MSSSVSRGDRAAVCAVLLGAGALVIAATSQARASGDAAGSAVLVWNDAKLFTEPSNTASYAVAESLKGPRKANVGHVVAMRVIASSGEFFEVSPIRDGGCTGMTLWEQPLLDDLRLFVRRTDIAPVLVQPWSATFRDGTSISLDVGQPVVSVGDKATIAFGSAQLTFEIPRTSIGSSYPERRLPTGSGRLMTKDYQKVTVQLGPRSFTLSGDVRTSGGPIRTAGHDRTLITLLDGCAKATVLTSKDAFEPSPSFEPTVLMVGDAGPWLPARAPLFNAKGKQLGTLRQETPVDGHGCLRVSFRVLVADVDGQEHASSDGVDKSGWSLCGRRDQVISCEKRGFGCGSRTPPPPPPPPPPRRAQPSGPGVAETDSSGFDVVERDGAFFVHNDVYEVTFPTKPTLDVTAGDRQQAAHASSRNTLEGLPDRLFIVVPLRQDAACDVDESLAALRKQVVTLVPGMTQVQNAPSTVAGLAGQQAVIRAATGKSVEFEIHVVCDAERSTVVVLMGWTPAGANHPPLMKDFVSSFHVRPGGKEPRAK